MNLKRKLSTKLLSNPYATQVLVELFEQVAKTGLASNRCLEKGYLPLPVDYHSPVPDLKDLQNRDVWSKQFDMRAIDFNEKRQLKLLKKLGSKYGKECHWPLEVTNNELGYYVRNNSFGFGCAAALHCIIKEYKPKRIIEIGSGNSSKIISQAREKNNSVIQYQVIDPYPAEWLNRLKIDKLERKRVELMPLSTFGNLDENDVLFIDSGHTVRIGGDVNYIFLRLLPRIKPGVLIHFHDIALPFEYGKGYALQEQFRQFWTEQYILHSFLCFNSQYEVLLAMYYLMTEHRKDFEEAFVGYDPQIHEANSGSFWIRRKTL